MRSHAAAPRGGKARGSLGRFGIRRKRSLLPSTCGMGEGPCPESRACRSAAVLTSKGQSPAQTYPAESGCGLLKRPPTQYFRSTSARQRLGASAARRKVAAKRPGTYHRVSARRRAAIRCLPMTNAKSAGVSAHAQPKRQMPWRRHCREAAASRLWRPPEASVGAAARPPFSPVMTWAGAARRRGRTHRAALWSVEPSSQDALPVAPRPCCSTTLLARRRTGSFAL